MKCGPSAPCRRLVVVFLSSVLLAHAGGRHADNSQSNVKERLPIPSGKYGVGRQALELVDNAQGNAHSSISAEHRASMVYIWYPAQPSFSKSFAEYFPHATDINKDPKYRDAALGIFGETWPKIVDGSIHSHAVTDAQPIVGDQFPVVLFFPGYSSTTFSYTAQIENLVSNGYVVVAVENTNDSGMVVFSDGRIGLLESPPPLSSHPADPLQAMIASAQQGTQTGAEQVRYILNVLKKTTPLSRIMNLSMVGVAGHSAGGTFAARTCQIDPRVKVCISEDGGVNPVGAFLDYPDHNSIQQPFLFIQIEHNPSDEELARMQESRAKWDKFLAHEQWQLRQCGKGSYFIHLHRPSMGHSSFSDGPVLNARENEHIAVALENLRLTEELEKAFLDKYLKGVSTSIFDRPDATPKGITIEPINK